MIIVKTKKVHYNKDFGNANVYEFISSPK